LANAAPEAPGAARQPESFVFPVTVSLDETAMKIDNAIIPLAPGMTATVEIRTDSRRVIDYLLSRLAKIGSEALGRGRRRRPLARSFQARVENNRRVDHKNSKGGLWSRKTTDCFGGFTSRSFYVKGVQRK
jgi:hypothetical protein